ncbi:hypothetical protein FQA39_LY10671 [Lamprigera yunnana]|nr:hypothetical protein FQA39_LY10671 [Lamprigera yunnana]
MKTMDSIPTSCIQLAKEQIIKYSDPKYNINDLKTGDCKTMLLNQTIYYLNKSKSKWINVGLYHPFEFASVVKIFGRSKQYVIFKEVEWIQFHEQRENINKKNKKKAKVKALLHLFHNLSKDSRNHSLKLNTIFSSNFCPELFDRFSKGIEICNKNLNGNICLK